MPINDSPESTWGKNPAQKAAWVKLHSPKSAKSKKEDEGKTLPKSEEALEMEAYLEDTAPVEDPPAQEIPGPDVQRLYEKKNEVSEGPKTRGGNKDHID